MAKFVLAGRADCPSYARAEMLADTLESSLFDFKIHKVVHSPDEWPSWLHDQCSSNGWTHSTSPLIWRELLDRGGKGLYLGGLAEFEEFALHYYGITPQTDCSLEAKVANENMSVLKSTQLDQQRAPKPTPLRVCLTNASSAIAYHLSFLIATGQVFGDQLVQLQLLDTSDNQEQLQGTAMELTDLASPTLIGVVCTHSLQEAFNSVSAAFILDFPTWEESHSETEQAGGSEAGGSEARGSEAGGSEARGSEAGGSEAGGNEAALHKKLLATASSVFRDYARIVDFCSLKDVRVIISGQFANTGAAIMARTVSSIPKDSFIASATLLEQQARALLAGRLRLNGSDVQQVAIWGKTRGGVVDTSQAMVRHFEGAIMGPDPFSLPLDRCLFESDWLTKEFPSLLAARNGRGQRSLTEAVVLGRLMEEWSSVEKDSSLSGFVDQLSPACYHFLSITNEAWRSVGVVSSGVEYGIPEGLVFSVPVRGVEGRWKVVENVTIPPDIKAGIAQQIDDLQTELSTALEAIEQTQQHSKL